MKQIVSCKRQQMTLQSNKFCFLFIVVMLHHIIQISGKKSMLINKKGSTFRWFQSSRCRTKTYQWNQRTINIYTTTLNVNHKQSAVILYSVPLCPVRRIHCERSQHNSYCVRNRLSPSPPGSLYLDWYRSGGCLVLLFLLNSVPSTLSSTPILSSLIAFDCKYRHIESYLLNNNVCIT